jgi:hypothetical protein
LNSTAWQRTSVSGEPNQEPQPCEEDLMMRAAAIKQRPDDRPKKRDEGIAKDPYIIQRRIPTPSTVPFCGQTGEMKNQGAQNLSEGSEGDGKNDPYPVSNFRNDVKDGHVSIAKHVEEKIDENETKAEASRKRPVVYRSGR